MEIAMKKSFFVYIFFSLFLFFSTKPISAQFEINKQYAGPTLGLAFVGSTLLIGANYEYGIKFEDFGEFGVGGVFRYWSFHEDYWSYTDILLGAQGNYHFKMKNKKIDTWSGLILAFDFGFSNWEGPNFNHEESSYGGFWIALNGGIRYWVTSRIALVGRIIYGQYSSGGLGIGFDYQF
jgi:hypothetical protein